MNILYYFIPFLLYFFLSNDFVVQWFLRFFLAALGITSGIWMALLPVLCLVGIFSDEDKKDEKDEKEGTEIKDNYTLGK